jgi:hypothetical protein
LTYLALLWPKGRHTVSPRIIDSTPTRYTIIASRDLLDLVLDDKRGTLIAPVERERLQGSLRALGFPRGDVAISVTFPAFAALTQAHALYFA